MTEQPAQNPFEPYRPGPAGGEQPHPVSAGDGQQVPPPWAVQPVSQPASPYSYGSGYGQGQQVHAQAALVLVLGILGLFFPLVAPVAWVLGGRAKREIERSAGRLGGMSQVMVGYVLGIVMSALMALFVALVVFFFVVVLVVAVGAGS